MRALIIEDNALLMALWCHELTQHGYAPETASSAQEAHGKLTAQAGYDVILSDLMLGDGSSLGLLDYARIKNPLARIILVTGSSAYAHGELHQLAPAADWILRKPVLVEDLAAVLTYLDRDTASPWQGGVGHRRVVGR